jgi:alpha-tubulin suppressor-like RCC1 family protein
MRAPAAVIIALAASVACASSAAAVARAGDRLYSFGADGFGQLGRKGSEEGDTGSRAATVELPGARGQVAQVAAGGAHALVVTSTGQLYAFGSNLYGELGRRRNAGRELSNPIPHIVAMPSSSGSVVQAAAGEGFSLTLTSAGKVYAFGDDRMGQLGRPPPGGRWPNPSPVPRLVRLRGERGNVIEIAAGSADSLVLTSSGQLYSFGANKNGQLGRRAHIGSEKPNSVPTPVALPRSAGRAMRVAAGASHTLVLTSSGRVYAFGDNSRGQLGRVRGTRSRAANPKPRPVALPGLRGGIVQIAAGSADSLILSSRGQLYTFGENSEGELGNGAKSRGETGISTPRPIRFPELDGRITRIFAGDAYSLVQTRGGGLYGFGSDSEGELGILGNVDNFGGYPTPRPLALSGLAQISVVSSGATAGETFVAGRSGSPPGAPLLSRLRVRPHSDRTVEHGHYCQDPFDSVNHCRLASALHIAYVLDRKAAVIVTIERVATGIWHGSECWGEGPAPSRLRCTFHVLVRGLQVRGTRGANSLSLPGRVGTHPLDPGSYLLSLTPRAGPLTGRRVGVSFRIAY